MTPLQIQDPKTFSEPNYNLIEAVIEQFFIENKEKFLSMYYKLSNTDKFYTLYVILSDLVDIDMGKRMFLEELRPDLVTLKELNKKENLYFLLGKQIAKVKVPAYV